MYAKHPKLAREFEAKTPKDKKLPMKKELPQGQTQFGMQSTLDGGVQATLTPIEEAKAQAEKNKQEAMERQQREQWRADIANQPGQQKLAMSKAWSFLKASRQMKLYNYIEDYPGKEPVTAFRGIHGGRVAQNMSEGVQPQDAEKWHGNPYEDIAPFTIRGKGSWWAKGNTPQAHEGASAFAAANDPVGMVMGYRGKLPKPIDRMGIDPSSALLGMHTDEYESTPMDFEESFAQHETNLDPDKLVWTKPSGIWEGME